MFKSEIFAKVIIGKYYTNSIALHLDIIESLNSSKITVRNVHEKIFHYKESKE